MINSKIYNQEERKRSKCQKVKTKIGDYMIT